MLPIEKEMIGLLVKGASTPAENIQISFFLVAWSALLFGALRMFQNGEEKKAYRRAGGIGELARDFAEKKGEKIPTPPPGPTRRGLKDQ